MIESLKSGVWEKAKGKGSEELIEAYDCMDGKCEVCV